jgi:hypothetical protein
MKKHFVFLLAGLGLIGAGNAMGQDFLQGPERVGQTRKLQGTVLGARPEVTRQCYLILADRLDLKQSRGMGGGGRFFLCGKRLHLQAATTWSGRATQTGTKMSRVGGAWRPMPVFEVAR